MSVVKERKRARKGEGRTPSICLRISHEEKELLEAIADAQGTKKSAVVRTALEGWLRRNKHLAVKSDD